MTKTLAIATMAVSLTSVAVYAPQYQSEASSMTPPTHKLWPPGHFAQERAIEFPDVPGYQTLVVDLHTHSVFSDGMVWPVIRVQESDRDGLDLLAVTEHLEYQPRSEDIPHPDRNRSFIVASEYAKEVASSLIIVNGAEVTRRMPPGHVNAVFVADANALLAVDPMDSFREANRQGAFVFWNHPSWSSPDGVARLTDMHRQLIADGQMHGIEVANEYIYSTESLEIALEHDLAILGVSDIHGLIDWDYAIHDGAHRTVTLVFAQERTAESVHSALRSNRTVAWMGNSLIGREDVLMPLIEESLVVSRVEISTRSGPRLVFVTLSNFSDAAFELRSVDGTRFFDQTSFFRVPPHSEVVLGVPGEGRSSFELQFEVLNAITAPGAHPVLKLSVEVLSEVNP